MCCSLKLMGHGSSDCAGVRLLVACCQQMRPLLPYKMTIIRLWEATACRVVHSLIKLCTTRQSNLIRSIDKLHHPTNYPSSSVCFHVTVDAYRVNVVVRPSGEHRVDTALIRTGSQQVITVACQRRTDCLVDGNGRFSRNSWNISSRKRTDSLN